MAALRPSSSLSTAGPMWPEGRRKWPAVLALGSPWAKSKSQWQGRRLALPLPDAAAERGSRSPPPHLTHTSGKDKATVAVMATRFTQ